MKRFTHCLLILLLSTSLACSQSYLGVFEVGETVPLLLLSADPQTHAPTDPADLSYTIMKEAEDIASGTMSTLQVGVAVGSHSTVGNATGPYHVLYAGLIQGTTIHKCQTYSLVEQGKGVESIAAHVMGLNGSTPMTVSDYIPYHNALTAGIQAGAQSVTAEINPKLDRNLDETKIATRELSRARLWFAQSLIDTPTRSVPADRPSHMEIQLASPADILFVSPTETFYRVYFYPNAVSATKASKEIRSATPPEDGTFYLLPDRSW